MGSSKLGAYIQIKKIKVKHFFYNYVIFLFKSDHVCQDVFVTNLIILTAGVAGQTDVTVFGAAVQRR